MDPRKIAELTMRDKIRDSQHLARELHEHLTQNLLPKIAELASVCVPEAEERIADVTIRSQVATVAATSAASGVTAGVPVSRPMG